MSLTLNGTTGVSLADTNSVPTAAIQDGAVTGAKIAAGAVSAVDLDGAQSGSAPIYGARAWIIFDGTTGTSLAAGNCTVSRTGVGTYTISFTTAMPDANYAVVGTANRSGTTGLGIVGPDGSGPSKTTTSIKIRTTNSADGALDSSLVSLAFFR